MIRLISRTGLSYPAIFYSVMDTFASLVASVFKRGDMPLSATVNRALYWLECILRLTTRVILSLVCVGCCRQPSAGSWGSARSQEICTQNRERSFPVHVVVQHQHSGGAGGDGCTNKRLRQVIVGVFIFDLVGFNY